MVFFTVLLFIFFTFRPFGFACSVITTKTIAVRFCCCLHRNLDEVPGGVNRRRCHCRRRRRRRCQTTSNLNVYIRVYENEQKI